jgi:hypothetical protein
MEEELRLRRELRRRDPVQPAKRSRRCRRLVGDRGSLFRKMLRFPIP